MLVFSDKSYVVDGEEKGHFLEALRNANILMIVAITNEETAKWIQADSLGISNVMCFDSSPSLSNKLGGSFVHTNSGGSIFSKLPLLRSKKVKESEEVVRSVFKAWDKHTSNDIRFLLLVIINAYIRPVPMLNNLRAKGFSTLSCMARKCGHQILNCLLDPDCRKALQCLNNCSPGDQVCEYRCLVSYENPQLQEFSLCVLQRHNCLEMDAKIPDKPHVSPMVQFCGENLDYEIAEDLLVGWLGKLDWSWRIVAGQNPAYDQFSCQYQVNYRGRAKGSFWCEPVFQVRTPEGDLVWKKRKYRVKRGKIPGKFSFSLLDSGVVSNEFWTIVDVCDDLSWGLFHYHGAAKVVGLSYSGAVLVSPDGKFPDKSQMMRLGLALDRCGIKEWELFVVDNCSCQNPPLALTEVMRLHSNIEVENPKGSLGLNKR